MANINLNKYFRNSTDIKSPVDSRIQLNKTQTDNEYYSDIMLDLDITELKERPLNAKESNRDLKRVVNEESIITSLRNIFNTHKNSRLLNPDMAFEIKQYLFEPLTMAKAWFLGYEIYQTLPLYEPRVRVKNVSIEANVNRGFYIIALSINIPSLNKDVDIKSILNKDGYTILG